MTRSWLNSVVGFAYLTLGTFGGLAVAGHGGGGHSGGRHGGGPSGGGHSRVLGGGTSRSVVAPSFQHIRPSVHHSSGTHHAAPFKSGTPIWSGKPPIVTTPGGKGTKTLPIVGPFKPPKGPIVGPIKPPTGPIGPSHPPGGGTGGHGHNGHGHNGHGHHFPPVIVLGTRPCHGFGGYGGGYCPPVYSPPVVVSQPVPVITPVPVVAAAEVVPVAASSAPAEERLVQIPVGSTVTLNGENLGATTGQVLLLVDKLSLGAQVNEWKGDSATATLPHVGLSGPTKAEIVLLKANGQAASSVKVELIASQPPAGEVNEPASVAMKR